MLHRANGNFHWRETIDKAFHFMDSMGSRPPFGFVIAAFISYMPKLYLRQALAIMRDADIKQFRQTRKLYNLYRHHL